MAKRQSETQTAQAMPADSTPTAELAAFMTEGTQVDTQDNYMLALPVPPTAIEAAQANVTEIEAALAVLSPASGARLALAEALAEAQGSLALAQAEAALQADKASELADARQAGAALAPYVLAAMLDAIEAKYAPVQPEAAPEAQAEATVPTRKAPGSATMERNALVAQALTVDTELSLRTDACIASFRKSDDSACTVQRIAGTRYASLFPFAMSGAGVANRADYVTLATAVRMRLALAPFNLKAGGASTASPIWLAAREAHSAGGAKGNDSLPLCFSDRREIAQYADGRFRYALPGTPNVRFIRTDAAAWSTFNGGAASASAAPQTPIVPQTPTTPTVPKAPAQVALSNGSLAHTARCQHCTAKNIVGQPACSACAATDWMVGA